MTYFNYLGSENYFNILINYARCKGCNTENRTSLHEGPHNS